MAKTTNVLAVLRLFSERQHVVRPQEIASMLDISAATAYRYVAELEQAGLIESVSRGRYVLGPAIVELDRQIRVNDPLIAAASEVMSALSERSGGTCILARLHGLKVVCVAQVRGRNGPGAVSYERGRAMPLYRGATSTVILAHLEQARLRELAEGDQEALASAGLPTEVDALIEHLRAIRTRGVAESAGAVDSDAIAWGAPIFHGRRLLGSLSVVLARSATEKASANMTDLVRRAALRIQGRLEAHEERSQSGSEGITPRGAL
ncbi:IclR family transcriptional regulator [Roseateles sp. SL47]|uniref:IclR family transcriptional regulator n=1 Tax=Roseateles sp. SL47 TaxID=2995138 RepID=UPI002271625C|nr:IclR family transcriptional regulator [Roseateles sp. SL47]WAC74616.1 IclR family transcriptional regulator [Roseateles sp. SL47]